MLVLGIETSCDETAAAVVARDGEARGRILSNVVRSQLAEHRPYGGVVPEIAARAHVECLDAIVAAALAEAGLALSDLSGIAATAGPGLNGGLVVGLVTGKTLALAAGKPFLAINHLEAHALTVGLTDGLEPPYLMLLVSGGHTQTLLVEGVGRYRRIGTTIDDAIGEAFDKTAKLLGLGYPGGPEVERAARSGDPERFPLPRPMVGRVEPHFSLAGLKTALRQRAEAAAPLTDRDVADLCAAFEAAVCDIIEDRVSRAMELAEDAFGPGRPRWLTVAGGVAANASIAAALARLAAARGFHLAVPPPALCTDNGAMIAWAGAERLARGLVDGLDFAARPRWPLDPAAPAAIGAGVKA
ncbi:tRNA (adenosine(37)-N6)-threonylcarbamoyltransferase complex transferase subunit TsaD [Hyphomicrobium sp.]|uniref:tRNA (adenosine(37)-N6)-threonylcarbamoyltransferase complex transferase subunit TsaD n=1 Tax=Hyphomicrobium sp. TaxID=82 RepID=UPI0025C00BE0|nr:tRNA (adenosine(37)-N6)-threonylcarbamoyltransferase complex transferase subunit TsaD [Hyphomicrobium sp.]MCC7252745.1 tRNA (adenosine(37)-N6)-threonylcarbamoyltransferase complex transferase subunit TsaD [Hyphomicrobium sp.]